jgi:hypothetical protein
MVTYYEPHRIINDTSVVFKVYTDENATVEYRITSAPDGFVNFTWATMATTNNTYHTVDLNAATGVPVLADGTYYIELRATDAWNNTYQTLAVFEVDSDANFNYTQWLVPTWDIVWLPDEDIIKADPSSPTKGFGISNLSTGNIFRSLSGNYSIIWYYDGTDGKWKYYKPGEDEAWQKANNPYWLADVAHVNDRPYWVFLTTEKKVRFEL